MNIYFWGLIISLIVYFIVGNYAGSKVKNLDDYYVAGRRSPTLLIVGTLVASFLSTNAFLAETGFAYDGYAFLMLVLVGVNTSGYVIGAVFFGRFVRRSKALTIPEYFARRFDSIALQKLAGLTTVIGVLAYLLAVTQGGAVLISEVANIPYGTALLIVWFGYMAFTMYSGSSGVIITDTIMFILFTSTALIGLPHLLGEGGTWFSVLQELATFDEKPGIIAYHGLTGEGAFWSSPGDAVTWAIILGVSWSLVLAISPWQTSRYLMAKNEHVVTRSALISGLVLAVLYIALLFGGAAVNIAKSDITPSESIMIWAAMNMMPTFIGTVLIAGVLAAALSSCSTFLSLIGFSVANDLLNLKSEDEKKNLRISRWTMFFAATIPLILAYFQPPAIMWITYFAGTLFASSWGPVALASVWSKRVTKEAAFIGMTTGFIINIAFKLMDNAGMLSLPVFLDPFVLGFVANGLCLIVITAVTKPTEKSIAYYERLHIVPNSELNSKDINGTLNWARFVMLSGVILIIFLTYFYAIPYAEALDKPFSIISGEALLSIGYGLSVFFVGLLAFWQVKKAYQVKNRTEELG